ncbi:MAG: hypothetical protein ACPG5B_03095 [Chitinophagales bacterium]
MISKTLFLLLKNLTKQERQLLADYLQSPYFNKEEDIFRLYVFLRKKIEQDKTKTYTFFDKNSIAKQLFPNLESKKSIRKTATLLKKLEQHIYGFIIQLKREENEAEESNLLLEGLNDRHINEVWQKIWKNTTIDENAILGNINAFRQHYLRSQNWHEFAISDHKLKTDTKLENVIADFEIYFIIQMLEYACAALNKQQKTGEKQDIAMLSVVLKHLETTKLDEKYPLIAAYKNCILLFQTQSVAYFEDLWEVLRENTTHFQKNELNALYITVINFAITQYFKKNMPFKDYILKLYEETLEHDILITNHYLAHRHFKNIFTIALHLDKIAWVKQFVEKYGCRLPPEIRHDMVLFSKASIAFYEKKYKEAQSLVSQVNEFNFIYHLNKELLLLKTFFLCQNIYLANKLESFRSYLKVNKQLSPNVKLAYKNFYSMLKQLHRLQEKYLFLKNDSKRVASLKPRVEKLLERLKNQKNIAVRTWLLVQTETLCHNISVSFQ